MMMCPRTSKIPHTRDIWEVSRRSQFYELRMVTRLSEMTARTQPWETRYGSPAYLRDQGMGRIIFI